MSTTPTTPTNDKIKFNRAVEEAFFLLDREQNRAVGPDEFCSMAKSIGIELDQNEALALIRTALGEQTDDFNHETKLTVDQYSTLMLRHVGSAELDDELRRTFEAFDLDRDGRISREDLNRLRSETTFFDRIDDDQYDLILQELLQHGNNCTDKTNGINFDQFVRLMMNS